MKEANHYCELYWSILQLLNIYAAIYLCLFIMSLYMYSFEHCMLYCRLSQNTECMVRWKEECFFMAWKGGKNTV
jgi:hypothetical protein